MVLPQTLPAANTQAPKLETTLPAHPSRITSIDILRALTMLLMIFVNDLWSLKDIPLWLEHVPGNADGLGLADTVFPAFLFIVGMSIPYSVAARRKKGDTSMQLVWHIVSRSIALLVMGVFLVDGENINAAATGLSRPLWNTLACTSFILIWNVYPKTINPVLRRTLQGVGVALLLTLAFLFRGGDAEQVDRFSTYWWGILGLIGWCYLVSALITAFAPSKTFLIAAWALFVALSLVSTAGLFPKGSFLSIIPGAIIGGTLTAFTLGGVLTTLIFQSYQKRGAHKQILATMLMIGIGLVGLGMIINQFWDISKIRATTPWLFLCSGFTVLAFAIIYWLCDVKGKDGWFSLIKPAGTNTLLCYLIPYFAYAFVTFVGVRLPEIMLTGPSGLLKSLIFALLCIQIAGLLARNGVRLKL